ncbi:MAG: hypothetical protein HY547_05985, partial [Elusimicrobia bacterium]|nr:hypothetical protein [Elusimicrobiota bacterium]
VEASDWPDLAALGTVLAVSGEATRPHGLNLARLMLEIPPKQQIIKKVWAGVAVAAGVMVALGLLRQMSARRLDSRLQTMAASMESGLPEIRDKDADAIKSLAMAKIQSVNVVRSALAPQGRFYLTLALQAIADQIPSEVWIDGFNYSSPGIELGPGSGRKDSVILSLTGRVENKGSQTDSAAVQEFLKNLKQVSVISKKFPVTDISFQKVDPGRASRSSRGGAVAAASEASVLSFSIDFKSDAKIAN